MTEALAFILPLSHRHLFLCLWASHQDLSPGCTFSLFLNHLSVYKWASHEDLSSRCTLLCSQTICLCTSEHLTRTCHLAVHSPLIPNHLCTSEHLIRTCHLAVHSPLIPNHLCTSEHLITTCHLAVHSPLIQNHLCTSEHLTRTCHPAVHSCSQTICVQVNTSLGLVTWLYTPLFPNHLPVCIQLGAQQDFPPTCTLLYSPTIFSSVYKRGYHSHRDLPCCMRAPCFPAARASRTSQS